MTTTYRDVKCLDCENITSLASNEPEENQRCVRCWQRYLEAQR